MRSESSRSPRILVVDDSEIVRRMLSTILRSRHWTVCGEAENGWSGVKKFQELKPDVVLLDLAMPDICVDLRGLLTSAGWRAQWSVPIGHHLGQRSDPLSTILAVHSFARTRKGATLKPDRSRKAPKMNPLLISLAKSIGSTLGTLAAKVDVAQKMLVEGSRTLKRRSARMVPKRKTRANALDPTKSQPSLGQRVPTRGSVPLAGGSELELRTRSEATGQGFQP